MLETNASQTQIWTRWNPQIFQPKTGRLKKEGKRHRLSLPSTPDETIFVLFLANPERVTKLQPNGKNCKSIAIAERDESHNIDLRRKV